ncbi:hypothetical protein PG985_009556 [Apiospora marii]|uniref:Ankyrin n=1 Tax=Apiospora marii TaxID=335849 RepID=A0ABR1RFM3_9PEZI
MFDEELSFDLSLDSTYASSAAQGGESGACLWDWEGAHMVITENADADADSVDHRQPAPVGDSDQLEPEDFSGYNSLHLASYLGQVSTVRLLLRMRPADATQVTESGSTPLHIAVARRHLDVVRALLEHGAESLHMRDAAGRTPLHEAIIRGQEETVRVLLDQGADPATVVM